MLVINAIIQVSKFDVGGNVLQQIRLLPPIHQLQHDARFNLLASNYHLDKKHLTALFQNELEKIRQEILHNKWQEKIVSREEYINYLFKQVTKSCEIITNFSLKRVINATGTILHTNLGRARLSKQAIEHVVDVAANYSNLEYNLSEAKRGSRHDIVENLLKEITGAESAMVVNNNAAAVYLILRTLAKDKEVIVSRGQLVEIGGSFRISAIMEESGAHLVEVGTTNKTHLYDYEQAITENTAMILKVHTSNFKTIGFTESVPTEALTKLTKEHDDIIYYEDLGSGVFFDFAKIGIGDEPVVKDVVKKGVDIVSLSGDKLLGGPQAGIIVGKKEYIDQLKKHQLARVLRVDKMTLAALEATLLPYLQGESRMNEIPTIRDLTIPIEKIKERAEKFSSSLQQLNLAYKCLLVNDESKVGGGTMPDVTLPTIAIFLSHPTMTPHEMAKKLRQATPSVMTRMNQNQLLLDFRTVSDEEIDLLVQAFVDIAK